MTNLPTDKDNSTKLLFFDNFTYNKPQYNVEEIFFSKAVNIQQFRILKFDSNPHAKYKSMPSVTQKDIIFNFEIFGRNLKKIDDKFELIFKCENINKTQGETDNIFPLLTEFTTNHIVFRGNFEKITMCIYGTTCNTNENSQLVENARNDVPLEKLSEKLQTKKNQEVEKKTILTKEEQSLLDKFPIEKLIENENEISKNLDESSLYKFKEINYINKENKNMIDKTKTGYIYYENDLKQIIENLLNLYSLEDKNISEQLILNHHINFKNLFIIFEILINRNKAHLEDDCVFNSKNLEIFNLIPENIINIINYSLKGQKYGESEIKHGLKLLKFISNNEKFVSLFISNDGMEQLYQIILPNGDFNNSHFHYHQLVSNKKEIISSTLLKSLALECIYKLITFNCAYEKLLSKIDEKKYGIKDFVIKESLRISNEKNDYEEEKSKSKEREKREKEKENSKHRKHKSRHSKSLSSSDSRYNQRSKSRSRNDSESSNYSRRYRTNRSENVILDNGFKILSALLISKKNILLTNIIKNITKKINLIQYLKNFNELINDYSMSENKTVSDLNKIQYHLQRLMKLIQKLDTPYHIIQTKNIEKNYQQNNTNDIDYPFVHNWIDYFDMDKKYFNKEINTIENGIKNIPFNNLLPISSDENNMNEEINSEYLIRNSINKYNPVYENIIITNEISELLEQYDFLNNIIIILSCPNIQSTHIYYSLSIQIKNFISLICLNIGGINYLAKNFQKTSLLFELLEKLTKNTKSNFEDFCFKEIKIHNFVNYDFGNGNIPNEIIEDKFSELIIPSQKITDLDAKNDLYIQINFLQIYYFLDYVSKYIHLFDDLNQLLENTKKNNDVNLFRQKSFNILFTVNQNMNKCALGLQAFLTLINNKYLIKIFFDYIELLSNCTDEIMEYEAHISLIINILYQILLSTNNKTTIFLYQNKKILSLLNTLQNNLRTVLDKKDFETIDSNLVSNLQGLISSLKYLKNSSISNLVSNLHDKIYYNILKNNLNEKINTNDEKFKNYLEEYKILVNKFSNDDINYLGKLNISGNLINEIFLPIKLLNMNFKINPLLFIDAESKHLHAILKYLIINTVNSLNDLLKKQSYNHEEGNLDLSLINIIINEENNSIINSNNNQLLNKKNTTLTEDYENIIMISNFLFYLFDILCDLLNNLLSSHVDHYRDSEVIDQLFSCLNSCFYYLYMFYSLDKKTFNIGKGLYKKINAVQNLFNKCLDTLHELCQFNTTIKLRFKDLINNILSIPKNIPCQLYLINFILNNNTNEFTIDHFIDVFQQKYDKINTDNSSNIPGLSNQNSSSNIANQNINFEDTLMMEQLENVSSDPISLKLIISHDKKKIHSFIDYIINMGMTTNDDFIVQQCAFIILNIFHKFTLQNNIELFQKIVAKIISEIKVQYEFLSKVNCLFFEEKDYEIYLPKIRNLLKSLKFLQILISSDAKFLFIFMDVAVLYTNIFKYAANYIFKKFDENSKKISFNDNPNEAQLCNYINDITLILLEGFKTLFNNKKNFEERYFFANNIRYDLVEELPNTTQITDVLKELNNFILIIKNLSISISNEKNPSDKVLFLINKTLEIFLKLSTNVCGQNLLVDNISLADFINHLKNIKDKFVVIDNKYLFILIRSLIKLNLVLFYDLNYYENKKKPEEDDEQKKFIITQQRLIKLTKMITNNQNSNDNNSNLQTLYNYNNFLFELLSSNDTNNSKSDITLKNLEGLQNILKEYEACVDVITIEMNNPTLPAMRRIQEKFEFIHVYNYFRQIKGIENESKLEINSKGEIENLNYNDVISTLNGSANSNINFNQMPFNNGGDYNKNQINEFDKLLSWKKARIFSNEFDTLKIRDNNFNIDSYITDSGETYEYKLYELKKKKLYVSKDPFEHYCNAIMYNLEIICQFQNLSAFIYQTLITKNYLFDEEEKHMNEIVELFFKQNINEAINLEEIFKIENEIKKNNVLLNINDNSCSNNKIKKKIKSKINY